MTYTLLCSFLLLIGHLFVHLMMLFHTVFVHLPHFLIGHLFTRRQGGEEYGSSKIQEGEMCGMLSKHVFFVQAPGPCKKDVQGDGGIEVSKGLYTSYTVYYNSEEG